VNSLPIAMGQDLGNWGALVVKLGSNSNHTFAEPVRERLQLRLAPADDSTQTVFACSFDVEGASEPNFHREIVSCCARNPKRLAS